MQKSERESLCAARPRYTGQIGLVRAFLQIAARDSSSISTHALSLLPPSHTPGPRIDNSVREHQICRHHSAHLQVHHLPTLSARTQSLLQPTAVQATLFLLLGHLRAPLQPWTILQETVGGSLVPLPVLVLRLDPMS